MSHKSFSLLFLLCIATLFACSSDDDSSPGPVTPSPPDEKVLPDMTFSAVAEEEGNISRPLDFKVKISAESDEDVLVDFATFDNTALAWEDYSPTSGTIRFLPGEVEKMIQIEILGDSDFEEVEDFGIRFTHVANAILLDSIGTVTLLNDDEFVPPPPPDGYSTPLEYEGYALVWQEEFEGEQINLGHWTHEIGNSGWGNNESQYYTNRPENSYLQDGKLIIEAKKENFGGSEYTSARMISAGKKEFQYGRIDVRAKLPEGQGIWPAIWMLGNNIWTDGWPACGEIDIMELIGHQPSTVHGTIHWDNNGDYSYFGGETTLNQGKFSDEFHVFSIIWDDTSIRWLLDDEQFHIVYIQQPSLSEFHNDFFFILNVAVGGDWPGYPNASTVFPQRMYVDYIRVFQE